MIIVDGIDEMHPELAKRIINMFVDEAETPHIHGVDSGNISIVLFGRPEGFRDYNIDPRRRKTSDLKVHELRPPIFRSRNDILILINNFNSYFRSKSVNVSTFINRFESIVDKYDFLLPAFGNLSHSNMLVQEIDAGQINSEKDLKLRLFNSLLERNHESHGRPTKDKEIYKKLMQAIARDYASKVDDQGYFQVNSQDMIKGTYLTNEKAEQNVSFNVISVLSRSGLVYMNPNDFYNPKFQFRPFWLHRFLVENSDI